MRFAKAQEKKMGKPEQIIEKREPRKSPISKIWVGMSSFLFFLSLSAWSGLNYSAGVYFDSDSGSGSGYNQC